MMTVIMTIFEMMIIDCDDSEHKVNDVDGVISTIAMITMMKNTDSD